MLSNEDCRVDIFNRKMNLTEEEENKQCVSTEKVGFLTINQQWK